MQRQLSALLEVPIGDVEYEFKLLGWDEKNGAWRSPTPCLLPQGGYVLLLVLGGSSHTEGSASECLHVRMCSYLG